MIEILKRNIGIIIIILLSYWAIQDLFVPGFFPMHDDTQPARIYEMKKALADGHFPVRWVPDLGYGYGYPLFNFYAPFVYYLGAAFTFLGFDFILATKIVMGIGIILSGISMYILGKELFGHNGGIAAGVAYMYAPYHAVNVYVRGDLAESFAYASIPFVFYGAWKLFETGAWKYVAITASAYAVIILSHNLTAFMMSPFLFSWVFILGSILYKRGKKVEARLLTISLFLGILLSAFYWLPALMEMKYTNVLSQVGGGADFRDHFVCLPQLWVSNWGYGGSVAGCIDGMSFKVGKIHLILGGLTILMSFLLVLRKLADASYVLNPRGIFFIFAVFGFLMGILLSLDYSSVIWELIPPMAFFQYPWRFLIVISFFSSLLIGFFVWLVAKSILLEYHISRYSSHILTVGIVIFLLLTSYKLFSPQTMYAKKSEDYTNQTALKWYISKISDEYMPKHFNKPRTPQEIVFQPVQSSTSHSKISQVMSSTLYVSATIESSRSSEIVVNKAYFPSWNIYLNNEKKNFTITSQGIMIKVPEGIQRLEARWSSTPIQTTANILSLVGVTYLGIGIIASMNRRKK